MKITGIRFNKWVLYFSFLTLGWISINFAQLPVGLENKVYIANVTSIVEDHDFNIINNIPMDNRWLVSSTYNYPDMHFDGLVVLHLLDAVVAKTIKPFFPEMIQYSLGKDSIYLFAICISTITLFFIASRLLFKLFYRSDDKLSNYTLAAFLFSTPLLYWTFSDYTSTDSLCFFTSTIILYFMLTFEGKKESDFFILGSLLGLSLVLKPSYFFYIPLFLLCLKEKNAHLKKLLVFATPVILFIACKYLNNYLRFGHITYLSGYEYVSYFDMHLFTAFLSNYIWGPFGIIHQAPWLIGILALFGLQFLSAKNRESLFKNSVLSGALFALLAKIVYEIFSSSNSETEFGFRRFVIDIPFLLFFLWTIIQSCSEKTKKYLSWFFTFTSLYVIIYWPWYRAIDSMRPSPMGIYHLWEYYPVKLSLLPDFFHRFNPLSSLTAFIVIGIFVTFNFFVLIIAKNKITYRISAAILLGGYIFLTSLNLINNASNVEQLKKENFFSQMVVSNNKNVFLYDEFFSEIGRDMLIAKYKRDLRSFNFSKQLAISFMDTLNEGLLVDPIGFKTMNTMHEIKSVNYLSHAMTTDSLFNFDSRTKFDEVLLK